MTARWAGCAAPQLSILVLCPDAPGGLWVVPMEGLLDGPGGHWTAPSAASPSLQSARGTVQLRGRASELEAELAEQQHLKQQAQDESEFLRTELEELKKQREDTEKAQRSLTEIESEQGVPALAWGGGEPRAGGPRCSAVCPCGVAGRAQANEQRYSKLKEKYSELVQNHADLLRKVGSQTRQHPLSQPCPNTRGCSAHSLLSPERRGDQADYSGQAGPGGCGAGEEGAGGLLPAGERAGTEEGE